MQDKKEKGIISRIKLDTIDAILHQISLFDQLESEQDLKPLEMEQIIKTVEKYIV